MIYDNYALHILQNNREVCPITFTIEEHESFIRVSAPSKTTNMDVYTDFNTTNQVGLFLRKCFTFNLLKHKKKKERKIKICLILISDPFLIEL